MTSDLYGSKASNIEYETEVNTVYASANFVPMPKINLNANLTYSTGTGAMDGPAFTAADVTWTSDAKLWFDTSAINPNQPRLYDVNYLNGIDDYSDLDFTQIDVNIGATYSLNNNLGLSVNYYYTDFDDDDAYVYGDQGGTVQSLVGFVSYRF